jgi:hypothetical protein
VLERCHIGSPELYGFRLSSSSLKFPKDGPVLTAIPPQTTGLKSTAKCSSADACSSENACSATAADCTTSCVCPAYGAWLNCALSHCWNEVYSCEYQNLAVHAAGNCPGAGRGVDNTKDADAYIPFVPAPANAPAACSCDISWALYRYERTRDYDDRGCTSKVANGTLKGATNDTCDCCAASEAVSTFYNTCPDTAPDAVPFWDVTIGQDLATLRSAKCIKALAGVDCHADIGFRIPGINGGGFYNASSLPQNGTATLSDMTGSTIASPLGGPTLVWKLGNATTFSDMTAVAVSATATPSGTSSSSATGTTAAGSSTASSTSGAASRRLSQGLVCVAGLTAVFLGMMMLI